MPVTGVCSSWFVSRFTDRFTPAQCIGALPDIKAMGFGGFELGLMRADGLDAWKDAAKDLKQAAKDQGLIPLQCRAGFLADLYARPETIASPEGFEEMETLLDVLKELDGVPVVVFPMGPFRGDPGPVRDTLLIKLESMIAQVERTERKVALELMPGAVVRGVEGFQALCRDLPSETLGLHLHTGLARRAGDDPAAMVSALGSRVLGVTLHGAGDDLDDGEPKVLAELTAAGYRESLLLDMEAGPDGQAPDWAAGLVRLEGPARGAGPA